MNRLLKTAHHDWREIAVPSSLTQSILLDETPLPRLLAFCVGLITLIMTAFIVWASLAHVDEITTASGQIVPSGYIQSVQQLDGGIVTEILVEEGQIVQEGQILFRLDATNANADLGQLQARQASLQDQINRYKSFANDAHAGQTRLTAPEQAILQSMINARNSQRRVLADQLAQKQKELAALNTTRNALEKNMQITAEQARMYTDMAVNGAGSRMMVLNGERDLNQLRGQLDETISGQKQAQDAIREIQSRMQSLDADLKQDAMKNMGQLEAELREVNKSLDKAVATVHRTTVAAPINGIVKGLNVHTLGAVIQPGQVLLDIVPVDSQMMAEVAVSPTDIGHVQVGQAVKHKIATYDLSRYGSLPGQVSNI
jgi:adhesin transport system membrane fusion protein